MRDERQAQCGRGSEVSRDLDECHCSSRRKGRGEVWSLQDHEPRGSEALPLVRRQTPAAVSADR